MQQRRQRLGRPRRLRHGEYAEVAGAGHTVAFDQPEGYRAVVEPFLLKLKGQG